MALNDCWCWLDLCVQGPLPAKSRQRMLTDWLWSVGCSILVLLFIGSFIGVGLVAGLLLK